MKVSKGVLRIISCVLVMCMLITGVQLPVYGADGGITTSGFELTIGNTVINESTTELPEISDGDQISIELSWALDNTDRNRRQFSIDFNDMIQNIEIIDVNTKQKITKDSEVIGEYTIEDGVLKIVFYDDTEFIKGDERYGGLNIKGEISIDDSVDPTDDEIEIQIGSLKKTVPFVNNASVVLWKDAVGSMELIDDGEGNKVLQQKYKLDIHTYNGKIILNSIDDILGSGLSNMSDVTVTTNSVASITGMEVGQTYTWEEFQQAVENKIIKENESIVIEYTANVDTGIYGNNAVTSDYSNKAQAYYNDKPEPVVDDATPSIHKTFVDKSGTITEENGVTGVKWTIKVYLNDLDDVEWDEIVTDIKDTLGEGLVGGGGNVSLDKDNFVRQSDGGYIYEYFTAIEDQDAIGKVQQTFNNKVDITLNHPYLGEFEFSDTATVTTQGANWISKDFVNYDADSKILTWRIKLDNIPENATEVVIVDQLSEWNKQVITDTDISIEYDAGTGTETAEVVLAGVLNSVGNTYDTDKQILNEFVYNSWSTDYCELKFNDDFIAAMGGKDVYINLTSKITTDDMSSIFRNNATLSYRENGKSQSYSDDAYYKDASNSVSKTGTAVSGMNAIDYTVYVDMTRFDIEPGKVIEIVDTLPEGLVLDKSTGDNGISSIFRNKNETWHSWIADLSDIMDVTVAENAAGDVITAQITINENFYDIWADKNDGSNNLVIELSYRAVVEDQSTFTKDGVEVSFTNDVSGTYDGTDIGSSSSTVNLTPESVVEKTIDTTHMDQNIVKYEVEINENELDLSDDKVKGTDTLGRGLEYILNNSSYPLVVEAQNSNGTWETLTVGSDYTYEYDTKENSLIFTLPDETYLRLSYYAKCNIRKDEYYDESIAYNQFSLSGIKENLGGGSAVLPKASLELAGWGDYQIGDITLYKFWNNGNMVALPGSEFALYKTVQAGNVLNLGALVAEDIVVNEQGSVVIGNLNVDTIYALVETKAAIGYTKNTEPYYFILPGSNMIALPSGYDIQYFVDNSTLYYENEKSATGYLVLTKTASGIDDWATVADSIEFVIKQDGYEVLTVAGSELDATTHNKTIELNVGTYEVTEIVTLPTGYTCETTYTVNAGASNDGKIASDVEITTESNTALTFANEYEEVQPEYGELTVTKTVTGDLEWDTVKANIKFEIYEGSTLVETIEGTDFDEATKSATIELAPGDYTVKEIVTDITGWTCTTTYVVGAGSATTGTEADVTVESNQEAEVTFTNDYEEVPPAKGELTVTKTVTGDLTWDDVKENVTFEILSGSTVVATIEGRNMDSTMSATVELDPGTYTVRETLTDVNGYTCETTYVVGTESETAGTEASAEVVSENEVTVRFTNTYEEVQPEDGELTVTKTVTGDIEWDTVKANIKFEIYEGSTLVKTIDGTNLDAVAKSATIELAPGDYTVKEIVTDVTGWTCTTTYVVGTGSATTGTEADVTVESNQEAEVTFTNAYEEVPPAKGKISVKKTVAGDLTWNDVKDKVSFEILSGNTVVETILGSDLDSTYSSSIEVEPGTYTVKEIVTDIEGYTCTTTYKVNAGVDVDGTDASVTVTSGNEMAVEFVNTYVEIPPANGNITVKKNVTGEFTFEQVKSDIEFEIIKDNTVVTRISGAELDATTLSKTIEVEAGTYTVRETVTAPDGYTCTTTYVVNTGTANTGTAADVVVAAGADVEVAFDNEYAEIPTLPVNGNLTVTKSIAGIEWDSVKSNIKFEISKDGSLVATILGTDLDATMSATIELEAGTYTVSEIVTDVTGYTCETTYVVGAGTLADGTDASVTVESNSDLAVTFTNTYTAVEPDDGKITVKKNVAGELAWDAVKENVKFEILSGNNVVATILGTELDSTLSSSIEVEPGTYTVRETVTDITGYTCTTTYTVDAGSAVDGNEADAVVVSNQETIVTFTNTYAEIHPAKGKITVTKTVSGALDWDTVKANVKFEILEGDNVVETILGTDFDSSMSKTVEVEPGTYTVKETVTDVEGYTCTTTYKVDTANALDGTSVDVDVESDEEVVVAFTNTYTEKPTEEPTTEEPTTEEPTTEEPTTEEPTTEEPTTEEPTTEEPTTEEPTTEEDPTEPEETEEDPTEPEETVGGDNPKTGDRGVGVYLISMLISMMVVFVVYASRKKETE